MSGKDRKGADWNGSFKTPHPCAVCNAPAIRSPIAAPLANGWPSKLGGVAMVMTQRDAQALTYLAMRLREETKGASKWDEHGTYSVVAKFVGQHLATSIDRVVRHAGDFEAKTPGAINRPFLPERPIEDNKARAPKKHEQCSRCGGWKGNCACRQESRAWDADDEPHTPMSQAEALAAAREALGRTA